MHLIPHDRGIAHVEKFETMWKLAGSEHIGKSEFMAAGAYLKKHGSLPDVGDASLADKPWMEPVSEVFAMSDHSSGQNPETDDENKDDVGDSSSPHDDTPSKTTNITLD